MIRLATPTTDAARLPRVLGHSSGFLYYVAIAGITGTKSAVATDTERAVARIRAATQLPIAVGFGLGIGPLGAYLAGTIATGTLMAVFLSNSGGAWDNAKKFVEDGNFGGKGSEAHAATVIGDTVGDPFKDTSSVAMNPVIKFTTLFGLLAVELSVQLSRGNGSLSLLLAGVFTLVSLFFVYKSFYGMRIGSDNH